MYVCQIPIELSNIYDGSILSVNGSIGLYFSDAWGFSKTNHPTGNDENQAYNAAKFTKIG